MIVGFCVIEKANDLVQLALRYRDRGVVAMDIAGNELIPLDQLQIDAIKVVSCTVLLCNLHDHLSIH